MTDSTSDFESTLAKLEQRVRTLEAGDVPLDQALALYEQGVVLAKTAQDYLETAETRVASLRRGATGIEETPLPH